MVSAAVDYALFVRQLGHLSSNSEPVIIIKTAPTTKLVDCGSWQERRQVCEDEVTGPACA